MLLVGFIIRKESNIYNELVTQTELVTLSSSHEDVGQNGIMAPRILTPAGG